ncbi:hypothetical protein A2814_01785 [Candidatus Nomurabacteria bacterium RIFCSPHIGHO2_01_FULL_38_19]|uniref:Uncharacterized protein n=1 Tax=Candidatus Nomurabacteria bacterium RIFCSPHIGHO2_01_FULL_38_19 TaxID=1801732 RepID=A0A1F6UR38_9BACT|nr:MAG: hypothetical protein A2814_01785 [Candidatus Nomurabacteria bacterium RIFCSPHIGHO2_01_FULL_38_19]
MTVEVSNKPIDYAKEIGNVVVHFTKKDKPVFFEILDASKFFTKAGNVMKKSGAFKIFPTKKSVFV